MENLKKNFEEPVVQIINMCFCENIATSGGVCPLGRDKSEYSLQSCDVCKVIYYLGDRRDWNKTNISTFDYIKNNDALKLKLSGATPGVKKLNQQVAAYGSKQLCPVGK